MQARSSNRRQLDWFAIGICAIVLLMHAPYVVAGEYAIMEWFRTDDAFYYFKTAQNISEGLGVTFDGTSPTNGFQPLWMALMVPIFSLARFDLFLPLRLVILLQTAVAGFTGVILYRLMSRGLSKAVSCAAALAFVFLPPLHNITMIGGTEAGISALMISLLLYNASLECERPRPALLRLGFIAALAFFARLDNLFLAAVIGPWVLAARHLVRTKEDEFELSAVTRELTRYYLPLGLLGGAYVLFNLVEFGHPTPISAQVKHWWGTLDLTVYGFPIHRPIDFLGQFMTDNRALGPWSLLTAPLYDLAEALMGIFDVPFSVQTRRGLLFAEALIVAVAAWRLLRSSDAKRTLSKLPLPPLLLACLMQITYYKVSGHLAQKPWYWVGEGVLILLVAAILVDALIQRLRQLTRGDLMATTALGLLLLGLLNPHFGDLLRIYRHSKPAGQHYYIQRARWLQEHTQPGAKIGMTGSGSTGYFTQGRTIVNLDGLISGREYFKALRAGTAPDYLTRIDLDYVFGNEYILLETQPYRDIFPGNLEPALAWPDPDRSLRLWRYSH